jgi:hypothetical protein
MSKVDKNVLWEIRCSEETSEGFHCGADVSLLSQFPKEKEMLFPPPTMLKVLRQEGRKQTEFVPTEVTAPNGVTYTRIAVWCPPLCDYQRGETRGFICCLLIAYSA